MRIILRILLILCLAHSAESEAQIDVISNENPSPVAKPPVKSGVRRIKKNSVPQKAYELAAELRYYRYSEPGVVEHKGPMAGIFGEWLWQSGLGKGRLQGAFHYGVLDYSGGLCTVGGNCTPYEAKTVDFIFRTSTRFDVELGNNFLIFGGLGYRFLLDKGEGVGFYQRLGQWAYLPVGVRLQSGGKKGDFFAELELDWIGYGVLKSSLSEVSRNFPDIVHNQNGYGYVVQAGFNMREDIRIAAVYEVWSLNKTNEITRTVVIDGAPQEVFFTEPKNESTSYGLRLGWTF